MIFRDFATSIYAIFATIFTANITAGFPDFLPPFLWHILL
jgi:hypothetical protein